jgi:Tol biopolymer transport system component
MADVSGELRWLASQPLTATDQPAAPARRANRWLLPAVAAAALVAGALFTWGVMSRRGNQPAAPAPALAFEIQTGPTDDPSVALSPDGTELAYVANVKRRPMLWLRRLDSVESRMLPGTEGASFPFWSPEGHTIAFFANDKLKRIEATGGMPIEITDAPNARGGAWGPNGVIIYAPGVSVPLSRISTSGGRVTHVTETGPHAGPAHRWPQFLPDGKRFLFHSSLGGPETNGVYIGSVEGTPPVRIVDSSTAGRFVPPDRFLTVQRGALVAYRFNLAAGTVEGEPMVVAQGFAASGPGAAAFSTAGSSLLAYRPGVTQLRQLMWVNSKGLEPKRVGEPRGDSIGSPELSPNEDAIAAFLQPKGDNDIGILDLTRNLPRLLTNGPPADAHPIWDPDGRHVVYFSSRLGNARGPVRQAIDGTGGPEPLFPNPVPGIALSWTRDRAFVLIRREGSAGSADLMAVSLDGKTIVPVADSSYEEIEGQFSPDGTWVAFVSNESGRTEVIVQSFPERTRRTQVSNAGGSQVRWSKDGREIFYIAPDGKMTAVALAVGPDGVPHPAPPSALFQTYLATGTNVIGNKAQYAVSRDGHFLLNSLVETPSQPIVIVTDWTRALKR